MNTVKMAKPKEQKKARGYRLKPSTHNMIAEIQKLLKCDQDKAIYEACKKFYDELIHTKNINSVKAA